MPNPSIIPKQSSRTQHFLEIADLYLALNQPKIFEVEPDVSEYYRPDVYLRVDSDVPVCVEVQRSVISNAKMQEKVDGFVQAFKQKKHDAKTLWIVANKTYDVSIPSGFRIVQKQMAAVI